MKIEFTYLDEKGIIDFLSNLKEKKDAWVYVDKEVLKALIEDNWQPDFVNPNNGLLPFFRFPDVVYPYGCGISFIITTNTFARLFSAKEFITGNCYYQAPDVPKEIYFFKIKK